MWTSGDKAKDGNPTNWVVLLIQKMERPWQCEIHACCEPQSLQGWSIISGSLSFIPILDVTSWEYVHYFKDGQ
jgi:hypothetical protein